ncbi:ABC transporter permease [Rhabdochlamydiaceae symbiont of Dictyostelium giganteum]|uniref:ABC transporter permease n=1 Tax=Rhabdochlamydiaceae symbiont of Dictyostelium giganteum TaxID=3342349 RepID=UPI00384B8CE4
MKLPKPLSSEYPLSVGMPAIVWQALFFYIPLFLIVVTSFFQFSSSEMPSFTFSKIYYFLTPTYFKVIGLSLGFAIATTCLCFCIAYPLAYFIAFRGKKLKNFFLFLLLIPFWTNFLLHVYAWFYVLETHGFLNNLLTYLGLIQEPLFLLNTPFAIMIMMVYYYLPFMVLPIYSSLERFDRSLIEASYDLGATWKQTFERIILPLTMQGVRAGFFLVYIPSFGEFAIPSLMGGDKLMVVGSVVSEYMLSEGTGDLGAAFMVICSLVLLVTAALFYHLLGKLGKQVVHHG